MQTRASGSSATSVVELLSDLSSRIVLGATLEEALEFIFREFDRVLPFDRIGFAEIDMKTRTVHAHWLRSRLRTQLGKKYSAPLAGSSLEIVLESGLPRILDDLPAYLEHHPTSHSTELIVREGMQSSMTWPLYLRGEPYAFLFFSSTTRDAFKEHHVATLKAIGNQLALLLMTSGIQHHEHDTPPAHALRGIATVPAPAPSGPVDAKRAQGSPAHADSLSTRTELLHLTPGMVVASPVLLENGRVLVGAGVRLTASMIARISALHLEHFLKVDAIDVYRA